MPRLVLDVSFNRANLVLLRFKQYPCTIDICLPMHGLLRVGAMASIGRRNCRTDEVSGEGCDASANDTLYTHHPGCDVMNNNEIRNSAQARLRKLRRWVHMEEAEYASEVLYPFLSLSL